MEKTVNNTKKIDFLIYIYDIIILIKQLRVFCSHRTSVRP